MWWQSVEARGGMENDIGGNLCITRRLAVYFIISHPIISILKIRQAFHSETRLGRDDTLEVRENPHVFCFVLFRARGE
jgi:hypothetical protein